LLKTEKATEMQKNINSSSHDHNLFNNNAFYLTETGTTVPLNVKALPRQKKKIKKKYDKFVSLDTWTGY
jgi:hypothetical protein